MMAGSREQGDGRWEVNIRAFVAKKVKYEDQSGTDLREKGSQAGGV